MSVSARDLLSRITPESGLWKNGVYGGRPRQRTAAERGRALRRGARYGSRTSVASMAYLPSSRFDLMSMLSFPLTPAYLDHLLELADVPWCCDAFDAAFQRRGWARPATGGEPAVGWLDHWPLGDPDRCPGTYCWANTRLLENRRPERRVRRTGMPRGLLPRFSAGLRGDRAHRFHDRGAGRPAGIVGRPAALRRRVQGACHAGGIPRLLRPCRAPAPGPAGHTACHAAGRAVGPSGAADFLGRGKRLVSLFLVDNVYNYSQDDWIGVDIRPLS